MSVEGKIALVTGSSRGIGREIALSFARQGCKVVVHYSTRKKEAAHVVDAIRDSGSDALLVQGNVTVANDVDKMVARAADHFGGIDILVNNAGWAKPVPLGDLAALTEDTWDLTVDSCLKSVYLCSRSVVPHMKRQPGIGTIVNIASIAGIGALGSSHAYSAAKAGVIALTRTFAAGLAPKIRVNAIAPGAIDTEWFSGRSKEEMERIQNQCLLKRLGRTDEVAQAALFLSSNGFMTGQTVIVDGGTVFT